MKNCVFCKIVAGELPSHRIYEDERTIALLDIHPVSPGHTLVITKDPNARTIFDVSLEDWMAMAATVHKIAPAIEEALSADGINIGMNNREHAGQVVDHPHIHLIPRFKGDGLKQWPSGSYSESQAEELQEKIRAQIS